MTLLTPLEIRVLLSGIETGGILHYYDGVIQAELRDDSLQPWLLFRCQDGFGFPAEYVLVRIRKSLSRVPFRLGCWTDAEMRESLDVCTAHRLLVGAGNELIDSSLWTGALPPPRDAESLSN